jgi:hypothetical protein
MAFHYDYSGVEFNLPNYQKYTVKVLGVTLLLVKLSSLIKTYMYMYLGGGRDCPPCSPLKKTGTIELRTGMVH